MVQKNADVYESLITEISTLDRAAIIERLTHFEGDLPLDFSDEFLSQSSTEHIRHLLLAALWRCRTKQESIALDR